MIDISSVNHVFDVAIFGILILPLMLLLHYLLEWISEIARIIFLCLNSLIQSWVKFHDGVIINIANIF